MVSYPDRPCPVCKSPMRGRQKSACSGRCRAALSRRKKAQAKEERDRRLRGLVGALAKEVGLRPEELG